MINKIPSISFLEIIQLCMCLTLLVAAAVAYRWRAGRQIRRSWFDSSQCVGPLMARRLKTSPWRVHGVGSARLRPLAAHGVGCPAAGLYMETGQLSRHYILVAEITLNMTLNRNKPNQKLTRTRVCEMRILHCKISSRVLAVIARASKRCGQSNLNFFL